MAPYKLLSKKQHTSRQVAARPSQPSRGSPSRVTHRRRRQGWHLAEDGNPEGDGPGLQTRARCGSLTAFVRQRYQSDADQTVRDNHHISYSIDSFLKRIQRLFV